MQQKNIAKHYETPITKVIQNDNSTFKTGSLLLQIVSVSGILKVEVGSCEV